jgi:hypothetical protein
MRSRFTTIVASLVLVALVGCDPGYKFEPVDSAGNKTAQWTTTIGGVKFTAQPTTMLIGDSGEFMTIGVENDSKDEVEVLGAQIESNGRTLPANLLAGKENQDARTILPGSSSRVQLLVELGGPAYEVLAASVVHVWRVRIGMDEHIIRIRFDR